MNDDDEELEADRERVMPTLLFDPRHKSGGSVRETSCFPPAEPGQVEPRQPPVRTGKRARRTVTF